MQNGILSHRQAQKVRHISVAMREIQGIRARKMVPGPSGRPLHEYVKLYIHARNPMLYYLTRRHNNICVLRIAPAVLELPGAVIVDRNAASSVGHTRTIRFLSMSTIRTPGLRRAQKRRRR
ncbi:MAG: DUF4433 domain-containing protein [Candidatus Desulforudis sp.]|nr:DUF4433 domain-containing protein [Desulforudis sp.]